MLEMLAHTHSHGIRRTGSSEQAKRRAAHRSNKKARPLAPLPSLLMPAFAICLGRSLPAWQYMWLCAFAIFLSVKWLTWLYSRGIVAAGASRSLAYFFLWPGMDAHSFLSQQRLSATHCEEVRAGHRENHCGDHDSLDRSASRSGQLTSWSGLGGPSRPCPRAPFRLF